MKKIKGFTINVMEINLNQRKFITSEIGRGVGIQPSGKGKGSYNRNTKHKKKWSTE